MVRSDRDEILNILLRLQSLESNVWSILSYVKGTINGEVLKFSSHMDSELELIFRKYLSTKISSVYELVDGINDERKEIIASLVNEDESILKTTIIKLVNNDQR